MRSEKTVGQYIIREVFVEYRRSDNPRNKIRFPYDRVLVVRVNPERVMQEEVWRSEIFPANWKTAGSKGGRAWACAEVIVAQLTGGRVTIDQITSDQQGKLPIEGVGRKLVIMSGLGERT